MPAFYVYTFAGCSLIAGLVSASSVLTPPDSSDPVIQDDAVGVATDQIAQASSPDTRTALADVLVAISTTMENSPKAQALYASGHTYFQDEMFTDAEMAFVQLAALVPGTLLDAEAKRMLAQIRLSEGNSSGAIAEYEAALAVTDHVTGAPAVELEMTLSTILPMLGYLYESTGAYANAIATSERILAEIDPGVAGRAREQALLRAARASLALGLDAEAVAYYDEYLTEYPDGGKADGSRIFVEIKRREAAGLGWGDCYADEAQFCADALLDPGYRATPARYAIGSHLVQCLDSRGHVAQAEQLILSLLADVEEDIAALSADPQSAHKADRLRQEGQGLLMFLQAQLLKTHGRTSEAVAVLAELAAAAHFGEFQVLATHTLASMTPLE